jgi:predicted esterase
VETAIKDSPIPILLIHGKNDTLIPYEMSISLSKTYNLWLYSVEGAKHFINCNINNSIEEYWTTLQSFLDSVEV